MEIKTPQQSFTVMTELVLSSHVNGSGRLFGGQLMSWMDIAGAICAKRHANCEVVTASAHQLEFFKPAMPNDVVVLTSEIYWVGRTSMKVHVNVHIEDCSCEPCKIIKTCSASFVYVAIDRNGEKHPVPRLQLSDGTIIGRS